MVGCARGPERHGDVAWFTSASLSGPLGGQTAEQKSGRMQGLVCTNDDAGSALHHRRRKRGPWALQRPCERWRQRAQSRLSPPCLQSVVGAASVPVTVHQHRKNEVVAAMDWPPV
jgi:hypothetical protein